MESSQGGAAIRSGSRALARGIALAGSVVAGVIVIGILLVVLEANPDNQLVEWITDAAEWLVGPFKELFTLDSRKLQTAVNWGLAGLVYFTVSRVIAGAVAR